MPISPSRASSLVLLGLLAAPAAAQEASAFFDDPVVVAAQDRRIEVLLDFDGDPYLDAAGIWAFATNDFRLQTWTNDGSGGLVEGGALILSSSSSLAVHRLAVGDLDGDGIDDLVYAFSTTSASPVHFVQSALGDGLGGIQPALPWVLTETGAVENLVLEDWDGDGRDDLALAVEAFPVPFVRIDFSQASGPPIPAGATAPLPVGYTQHLLFRAEVNGDGVPDLAAASVGASGTVLRLFPVTGGVPAAGTDFVLPGVNDPMPVSGDVDGDGDDDLVVFRMTTYQVFRRTGPSTFVAEPWTAGGPATDLADVDGDGDLDGTCCGGGGGGGGGGGSTPLPPNTTTSTFRISLNDGTGVFAPAFTRRGLGAVHLAGAADLDLDGDVDLVAGRCVYYNPGAALLGPHPTVGPSIESIRPIFDADGDGDPDLAVGLDSVQRNDGDGAFAASPPVVPAAPAGTTFAGPGYPGDFDGDGDVDLLVRQLSGSTVIGMRLLRNTGGGGFVDGGPAAAPGTNFTVVPGSPVSGGFPEWTIGTSGSFALAADADGDGDLDLVLRRFVSRVASVIWWNDGSGFFASSLVLLDQNVKRVADLNADGLPDLLLGFIAQGSTTLEGPCQVRLGTGGGAFAPASATLAPLLHTGDGIDVADMDGDGDLDVGIAHAGRAIWPNDGAGGFPQAATLPVGPSPGTFGYFRWLDVDGDGIQDVLAAPQSYGGTQGCDIYRGTGAPLAFAPPVTQTTWATSLLDADGDGDTDSASYEVVRNRSLEGLAAGSRRQFGSGLAGTGAMTPTLGLSGPIRPGTAAAVRLTGGLGGSVAILAVGDVEVNVPALGGTVLANPLVLAAFPLGGAPGAAGEGSIVLPWIPAANLAGLAFYAQAFVLDAGAPQGVAFSNAVRVGVGL